MRKKIIALCLAGVMAVMPIAGMGGTMAYAENTNTVENSSPSVSTRKLTAAENQEESSEVLADFTFDDEETGFTNGYGVATGAYTLQDHDGGKALHLDGTSEFLEVKTKDGGSLLSGVKELTVSFQAKPDKKNGNWLFYAARDENSQTYQYEKYLGILGNEKGDAVAQRFYNSGSRSGQVEAPADGDDWYYLTVVQTETETILYINGEEAAREPSSYPLTDILGENSILYIGKANWGKGEYYKGLIDNYKIIGRALSAEEVKKLADEYTARPVYFDNALSRLSAVQSGNTFEQITDNAQFEPGKEYLVVCGDQVLRWDGSTLKGETPEGIAGINTSRITLPDTLTEEESNTYLWCMQKAYDGEADQYTMHNVSAEKQEKCYWNLTTGAGGTLYGYKENNTGFTQLTFISNGDGSFNVTTKFQNRSFYMNSDGTIANDKGTSPVKIYKRQIESEGIQYSTDSGQTWQMMRQLSDADAPEGEFVCIENLWQAQVPKDAKTIMFRGKYPKSMGIYLGGIYATENYNLTEYEAENCFYGAPVVDELSKDTTVGGSWGKVDEINDLGDASRDIPEGTYTRDPNLYYATSEFYDYYSDYELWGKKLKDSSKTEYEDQYDDQPLFSWNLAIRNLYQNSEGVYPLYFGGSRMLNAVTGDYLRSQLWNYRTQIACGNGFAGVNTELKPGETGRVFPNMGLLNQENPLSTLESGNVLLKNSEIESPYFNKEFLTGKNQEKAVYGAVYENVEFPFERDTESGYWTFDSAKKQYAVRMMQDTKTGEYYLERTGSSDETKAVTYAGRPFFFPFNQGGDYTEKGKAPYSVANLDYMFGAKVEVPFSLSENRTTTVKKDETGKDVETDCIFTFSGDDDVWIFVEGTDGKEHLVLDIGGSHGAVSGAIDFTTGNVAVSGKWNYLNGDTTASAMSKDGFLTDVEKYGLSDAYVTENDQWIWHATLEELGVESADNKFEPYKEYKIKVYYMERGLDQSNLRITFNFAKNKNAEIQKIWSDGEERHAGDSIDMCLYQAEGSKTTDVKVTATEDIGDGQSESGEIALNAGNRWSYKWGRLKPNVDYDVTKAEYQYYIGEKHVPDGYRVRYYDPDGEEIPPIELTLTDGTKVKAVPAGEGVKITAKNYLPGTLALVKEGVDEGTGAPVLPGVGFELYNASVNEDGSWTKTGLVTDGAKTTDQGGNVVFDDLIDGNYLLYETKAADRYLCPEEPWKITVDGRGNVTVMLNDGTAVTETQAQVKPDGLEDIGEVSVRNGALLAEDLSSGKMVSVTEGWISGGNSAGNGGGIISSADTYFRKSAFTLYTDVCLTGDVDAKGGMITIGTADGSFKIRRNSNGGAVLSVGSVSGDAYAGTEYPLNIIFEKNKWYAVGITYQEDETQGYAAVYVNGSKVSEDIALGFKLSEKSGITAGVGIAFKTGFMQVGSYDNIRVFDSVNALAAAAETAARAKARESGTMEAFTYTVITNEKLPLKLSILKVDSQDAEVTLAGARFVMKKGVWDKNEKMFHEDSEVAPYSGTSDPSGLIEMKALLPGEYRLEEIQAPDGYSKLVKPIILRIEKDGGEILSGSGTGSTVTVLEENSLKITVANAKGYVLPDTGGTGTYGYTITGSILLFLALVAFGIDTWRRRQTCREGGKRTEKSPHDKVTRQ